MKFFQIFIMKKKLLCSIDKWGLLRGTKNLKFINEDGNIVIQDRPEWFYELKMHWDLNPWLYVEEMKEHQHPMYQGLIALVDCPIEVGGFLCVPGSSKFLPEYTKERKPIHLNPLSIRVPSDDIMLDYKQKVPLRKGEMVIWNSGQAHANFGNTSNKNRIYQFVRMLISCEKCKERDRFSAPRVLEESYYQSKIKNVHLSPLGKKLVGIEKWD